MHFLWTPSDETGDEAGELRSQLAGMRQQLSSKDQQLAAKDCQLARLRDQLTDRGEELARRVAESDTRIRGLEIEVLQKQNEVTIMRENMERVERLVAQVSHACFDIFAC